MNLHLIVEGIGYFSIDTILFELKMCFKYIILIYLFFYFKYLYIFYSNRYLSKQFSIFVYLNQLTNGSCIKKIILFPYYYSNNFYTFFFYASYLTLLETLKLLLPILTCNSYYFIL